jgi:glutamate-ammonia-ligase adenylyltransferase
MVSSLENFRHYQRHDAWIWEHQALLRSRSVAGSPTLRAAFESERRDVLVHHVDRPRLAEEVPKMRRRMRKELSKGTPDGFDLKQDPGGLADIEFLVDYWVLANAHEHAELVAYPDNVRQLEALEHAHLLEADRRQFLTDAYLALRRRIHELALAEGSRVVGDDELRALRGRVVSIWTDVFGPEPGG